MVRVQLSLQSRQGLSSCSNSPSRRSSCVRWQNSSAGPKQPGDHVEVRIDGIGSLRNTVVKL